MRFHNWGILWLVHMVFSIFIFSIEFTILNSHILPLA
nr:MAG TPA: hypothetical protein [Caudoviricetes sp.]